MRPPSAAAVALALAACVPGGEADPRAAAQAAGPCAAEAAHLADLAPIFSLEAALAESGRMIGARGEDDLPLGLVRGAFLGARDALGACLERAGVTPRPDGP